MASPTSSRRSRRLAPGANEVATLDRKGRLTIIALLGVSAGSLVGLATLLHPDASDPLRQLGWAAAIPTLLMALTILWLSRSPRFPQRLVPAVAIPFVILSAIFLSLTLNQVPWPTDRIQPGWSPVAVWALICALVMVFRPWRAFWSTLAATATEAVVVGIYIETGVLDVPDPALILVRLGPNLVAPILAAVVNFHMWRVQTELSAARELGSYRLVERIGQGGMGEVWRAEHTLLKRPAAVKLILPSALGDDDRALRRFEREAQATAQLRSPHTVDIYDYGVADDGAFYYVMELLDGLDLATLVSRFGPQPPERVVHILRHVCHSLAEAHARELIHRDIKPANLFACRYGLDTDHIKVLDFGLVKGPADDDGAQLTHERSSIGTPAYMAPEQVLSQPLDGRTDLYSLGCVAYALLTGHDPFEDDLPTGIMISHVRDMPPPPSEVTELPIPAALEGLVMQCLAKAPQDRPATAQELADRLAALTVQSPWSAARADAWWDSRLPVSALTPSATAGP